MQLKSISILTRENINTSPEIIFMQLIAAIWQSIQQYIEEYTAIKFQGTFKEQLSCDCKGFNI